MKERWGFIVTFPGGEEKITPMECTWIEIEKHTKRWQTLNGQRGFKYRYIKLRSAEA
jgi:hypothetical protein